MAYKDKQKQKKANAEWVQKNKARHNELSRNWKARNPDKVKASTRKRETGHTPEIFESRRLAQNNKCAICYVPFDLKPPRADHDHKTGNPRGLLCQRCNVGLGLFLDSRDALLKAISYLDMWS